ncbi:MAG: DNA-binding response regulator [Magnetococcales bacterium]|nr:DNA-binding response regulator [Magnetococcales bacterium]HIJ83730.1 response regulator transcription factor [Magnetococcales bacterium]
MIRIFIVDDHAIMRDGLKRILTDDPNMVVVGEAGDGTEAMEKLRAMAWDVLLLDISMPGTGGLEVLQQVMKDFPQGKVLILTQHNDGMLAKRYFKAGALGFITKVKAAEVLIKGVRKVAWGSRFLSDDIAEQLIGDQLDGEHNVMPHETLTDREYGVMRRIVAGVPLKVIAHELSLSVSTVSTYRNRVLAKVNVENNAELIQYAIKNGLLNT